MRTGIGGNGGPPLYGSDSGWVAIARAMRAHSVVGFHLFAKPCDPNRGAMQPALAWIDLIMECRYTAGEVMNNGRKMALRRGQLLGANLWLAQRWNWTPKATRTWLAKLELYGMISFGDSVDDVMTGESSTSPQQGADEVSKGRSKGRFANVLTICNYDLYQLSSTEERQVEKSSDGRLEAGCGQVEGRSTDIKNARAKTKEQETREQENQEEAEAALAAPVVADAPAPVRISTLCVPPTARKIQPPPQSARPDPPLVGELFGPGDLVPIPQPSRAVPTSKADLDALEAKLLDACNGALDDPVNCLGLSNLSIPQSWIREGLDLDLDILPGLRAAGKRYHGKRIRSWDYFTDMLRDGKARRETSEKRLRAPTVESESKTERIMRLTANARSRLDPSGGVNV